MNRLNQVRSLCMAIVMVMVTLMATPAFAAELDDAIESGFGKLIKYGRWTAALILAIVFVLGAAQRSQNSENPHEQQKGTKQMVWSGTGFVAVIGYKLVLTGLVAWFNVDPAAIPSFLWQ